MGKEKKIGIKYYLNKNLNPQTLGGVEHYPVYVRVTYNRTNTQFFFPVLYKAGYVSEEEFNKFFENRENKEINCQISEFENLIERIVRFESKKTSNNYTVSGLSQKIEFYQRPIISELEVYLKEEFKNYLSDKLDKEHLDSIFHDAVFFTESYYLVQNNFLSNLTEKLPSQLKGMITAYINYIAFQSTINQGDTDYTRVIDWTDERHQIAFKRFLLSDKKEDVFKTESPSSPVIMLFYEFKVTSLEVPRVLATLDKMVVNAAE